MDVNNYKVVSPRLIVHKVITALTSYEMCHNRPFRKKVPVNADSRSSRVFVTKNKGTKEPKSWSQHLNNLEILVLSMHFLETQNVAGVKGSFELSVPLSGENRSNKTPGVPSDTSHAF